jgi:hypothetical protein
LDWLFAIYVGDEGEGRHMFEVAPFGCPGCHKIVRSFTLVCGGFEVSEELDKINHKKE